MKKSGSYRVTFNCPTLINQPTRGSLKLRIPWNSSLVGPLAFLHFSTEQVRVEMHPVCIYLSIKRVALQLILTLELPGVSLVHGQTVLCSLEDLSFVYHGIT